MNNQSYKYFTQKDVDEALALIPKAAVESPAAKRARLQFELMQGRTSVQVPAGMEIGEDVLKSLRRYCIGQVAGRLTITKAIDPNGTPKPKAMDISILKERIAAVLAAADASALKAQENTAGGSAQAVGKKAAHKA